MRSEVRSDSRLFRTLSRALLEQGISIRFRANGRSMFPAIVDGDVVEVQPAEDHSAGDLVLVENSDGLRVHRMVSSPRDQIVTRGDSCFEDDETATALFGRVSRVVARDTRPAHTLRTRLRWLACKVLSTPQRFFR